MIRTIGLFILLLILVGCATSLASPPVVPELTAVGVTPTDTRKPEQADTQTAPGNNLPPPEYTMQEYPVPAGSRPHDVAPAEDGSVWYTAQRSGALGRLDPAIGETHHIPLGIGSSPHGVIVGPDGSPWITDSGLNAIVRVDPLSEEVQIFPLPEGRDYANLNTAVFDIEPQTSTTTVLEPPTAAQGARRVWSDSQGQIWLSEWIAGQLAVYDPSRDSWREWKLPGDRPQAYAVYVDDQDIVWLSDFGSNSIVRFDPVLEQFTTLELPSSNAAVRQILGRPGEVSGAESGADKLVVIRTDSR
jgi:virginiamycin B lyase